MRLYFIRHGQTISDIEDRYGGAYDDLLSPLGEQQTRELAHELSSVGIERVFASSLKRAQQTAQLLADHINCPLISLPDLKERDNYGFLSGLTKTEAHKRYPDYIEMAKDRLNTLPGAESYKDASERMSRGYKEVVSQTQFCSAVVWHGGGMRVLFRDILEMGELKTIGDCAWVELEKVSPNQSFIIKNVKRMAFDF